MYPVGHTCGFSVDVPFYSNAKIMHKQIHTAIVICNEYGLDGLSYGNDSNGGDNSSNEDQGENSSYEGEEMSDECGCEGDSDDFDEGESEFSMECD